jgi:hypothetical protein
MLREFTKFLQRPLGSRPPRRRPHRSTSSLGVEVLEDRQLLDAYGLGSILNTLNQGTQTLQCKAAQIAAEALGNGGLSIPIIKQSINDALGLTSDIQRAFNLSINLADTVDLAKADLARAGFNLGQLSTSPDANGDLLRVSTSFSVSVTPAFTAGGAAEFSYLQDNVTGSLSGSLTATSVTISAQATFGVDVVNGTPTFFVTDSSGLSITGLSASGTVSGDLDIGSLVGVQSSGTAVLKAGASLTLQAGHPDHKVRLDDFNAPQTVVGAVNGTFDLQDTAFTAQLPLLPDISWSGSFHADLLGNQVSLSQPAFDTSGIASEATQGLLSSVGNLPLLGPLQDFLQENIPLANRSLADILGLADDSPDAGSEQDASAIQFHPENIEKFIQGQPNADLVTFDLAPGNLHFGPPEDMYIPIFELPLGIVDVSAGLYFGWGLDLNWAVHAGVDTQGLWLGTNTRVSISGDVHGGLQGGADLLGGLIGGDLKGGLIFEPDVGVGLKDFSGGTGRDHLADLHQPGNSVVQDVLGALQPYNRSQFGFHAELDVTVLWFMHFTVWQHDWSLGDVTAGGPSSTASAQDLLKLLGQPVRSSLWSPDHAVLYAVTTDGWLYAYDQKGWQEWKVGRVRSLVLSPDGQTQYVLTRDGWLHSHDAGGWHEWMVGQVRSFALSPDGQTVYALTYDGRMLSHDDGGWHWFQVGEVQLFQLSPDGRTLYLLTSDGRLLSYDGSWHSWQIGQVQSFALSPDGLTVYALTYNGGLYSHDAGGWHPWQIGQVRSFALSPDGQTVYALTYDGWLYTHDQKGWQEWEVGQVRSFALSPDGQTVYAVTYDGWLYSHDNGGWHEWMVGQVRSFALSPDGQTVYALTYDGRLLSYDGNWHWLQIGQVQSFALSPDGQTVYALTFSGQLLSDQGGQWSPWEVGSVRSFALSKDGQSVYVVTSEGRLLTLDSGGWTTWEGGSVRSFALSPDGQTAYVLTTSGQLLSHDSGGWHPWEVGTLRSFALSPDGQTVYILTAGGLLNTLDASGWHEWEVGRLSSFALSPDGQTVYILTADGRLNTLDRNGWNEWEVGTVRSFTLAPDGRTVYVLTADGRLLWLDGGGWHQWEGEVVQSFAVSPDGGTVYVLTADGSLATRSSDGTTAVLNDAGSGMQPLQSFALDGHTGTVYALDASGNFEELPSGGTWMVLNNDGAIAAFQSFVLSPSDNTVYALDTAGVFYSLTPSGSWTRLDASQPLPPVQSYAVNSSSGTVYALDATGTLWQYAGGSWAQMASTVEAFVAGPEPGSVDVVLTNGQLWQLQGGTTWSVLDQAAVAISLADSGFTLVETRDDESTNQFSA